MTSIPARSLFVAILASGITNHGLNARSFSFEQLGGCLYQLAKPLRPEPLLLFSLAPLAERIALDRTVSFATAEASEPEVEEAPAASTQFSSTFVRPAAKAPLMDDDTAQWPLFQALKRFQSNPEVPGLSRSFSTPHSYMALDYSDIFETGRAAYKGGHGVSLLLRRTF